MSLYESLLQPWYNPLWLTGLRTPINWLTSGSASREVTARPHVHSFSQIRWSDTRDTVRRSSSRTSVEVLFWACRSRAKWPSIQTGGQKQPSQVALVLIDISEVLKGFRHTDMLAQSQLQLHRSRRGERHRKRHESTIYPEKTIKGVICYQINIGTVLYHRIVFSSRDRSLFSLLPEMSRVTLGKTTEIQGLERVWSVLST